MATLQGTTGNDSLYGTSSNDTLNGGLGDDFLQGGAGADVYIINKGDGIDTIDNNHTDTALDTLYFSNLLPSEVKASRNASDLIFKYGSSQVTVKQYFDVGWYYPNPDGSRTTIDYQINKFTFSDGTVWSGVLNLTQEGTNAADTLQGGEGNDTLIGGKGNDFLQGDAGADTYLISKDDGLDIIKNEHTDTALDTVSFVNLLPSEVKASRVASDLILSYGTSQSTVKQYFDTGWYYTNPDGSTTNIDFSVNRFTFSNGSVWSGVLNLTQDGTTGNDTVQGSAGNDTLNGGKGNDFLQGDAGADTYVIRKGDGLDIINNEHTDTALDTVNFADLLPSDVTVSRTTHDLIVNYGTSQLTIQKYFDTGWYYTNSDGSKLFIDNKVNAFTFSDGTVWTKPESYIKALPYFVAALDSGLYWGEIGKPQSLTYSFATVAEGTKGFQLYTPEQQTAVRTALGKYSAIANVTFTEVVDSANTQLRFFRDDLTTGGFDSSASGYSQYPVSGGDVHIRSTITDLTTNGFGVVLHEIGHALGMKHPFNGDAVLNIAENNQNNTVMSYTGNYSTSDIQLFDKATIHYLYGVNASTRAGNDTYHFSDKYIWDGAGIDTLSAAEQTLNLNIDLNAGSWSYAGAKDASLLAANQAFIGFGTTLENATGGSGNDVIIGNAAANTLQGGAGNDTLNGGVGADKLVGGTGNDVLIGGANKDTLTGGTGADKFVFNLDTDSGIATATRDTITDFSRTQGDKIDLSGIDANLKVAGDNAFTTLNSGTLFSGSFSTIATLFFDQTSHILYGNNDKDAAADFSIALSGVTTLATSDFVL